MTTQKTASSPLKRLLRRVSEGTRDSEKTRESQEAPTGVEGREGVISYCTFIRVRQTKVSPKPDAIEGCSGGYSEIGEN